MDEVIVVEPDQHRIRLFVLAGDTYAEVERSPLLGVNAVDLTRSIRWP